jgi:hypothetical protein
MTNRIPRGTNTQFFSVQLNGACLHPVGPENQAGSLGSTGSDQPGQANDFSRSNIEGHATHLGASSQLTDRQPHLAGTTRAGGEFLVQATAHHQGDHLLAINVFHCTSAHVTTISKNSDAIRDRIDLIKSMTDVNDPYALRPQFSYYLKQPFHFARGQRRGWFIHHNDTGILGKRLGYLNDLLLSHRQLAA